MGFFLSQTLFKYSLLFPLLFLVLLSSSSSSSVLHDQTKPLKITGSDVPDQYRQVFHIKNTSPLFLDRPVAGNKKMRNKIMAMKTTTTTTMTMTMTMTMMRKKIKNTETNRPNFSVMLPKGFVPPSGSSPCHNENPNSVVFFCQLATPSEP